MEVVHGSELQRLMLNQQRAAIVENPTLIDLEFLRRNEELEREGTALVTGSTWKRVTLSQCGRHSTSTLTSTIVNAECLLQMLEVVAA